MKKYLFTYAVLATALLFFTCRHYRAENRRLVENQTALAADVTRYRTRLGAEAASVQALRLRCGEFETLRAADAEQIRRLGIRLRRLEAAAKAVAVTDAEIRTPLRDTVVVRIHDTLPVRDTVRMFRWRDPWISVEGCIGRLPHPQRRHPAPGGPPHPAPFPLHPLGHEGPPAGDRLDQSPHTDRLCGVRENRTLKNFPQKSGCPVGVGRIFRVT